MNIAGKSAANRRKFIRKYTLFKIAVYDADTKRFVGLVQDLSEGGMQLFGVKVDKNEARTLIVQASQYLKQGGIIRLATRRSAPSSAASGTKRSPAT